MENMYNTTVMMVSVQSRIRPLSTMPLTSDHKIRNALIVLTDLRIRINRTQRSAWPIRSSPLSMLKNGFKM